MILPVMSQESPSKLSPASTPGYYASGTRPAPVIHVERVYYRTDPIITVVGDLKIYPLDSYLSLLFRSAEIWNELEKCGVTDVKGVWQLESGMRFLQVISLRQRYGGHARPARADTWAAS